LLPLFGNDRLIAREDRRHPRPSDHPAREQTEFQYVFIFSGIGSISTATASWAATASWTAKATTRHEYQLFKLQQQ
jgi:hypothetical protein